MRIALFTETFLPKVDGVVNTICRLMEYLAAEGHEALLFAPSGAPAEYSGHRVIGLRSYRFPLYPEIRLVPPYVNVSEALQAFRPDLVHLANPFMLGLAGWWHSRRLGIPVVASYHTDLPGFIERWGYGAFAGPVRSYTRWLHNKMLLNLCPSCATVDELHIHGFQRLKVWTRGVDTQHYTPGRRDAAWRGRLSGGHPEEPLMLFVGRVAPEKRIDWIRPVMDANPRARLAIVGDGPALGDLEAIFEGTNTRFMGFLPFEELPFAYASADVFIFPAANETFGNVILEAMASGVPVVAARAGGPLDSVVEEETGLLFSPFDSDDLVKQATRLLQDPTLGKRMGEEGRRVAETRKWYTVMKGLVQDYESVLRKN